MNIAGFEFGCEIDGTCPTGSAIPPLSDGPGQMQHFVKDDQMNIFRLRALSSDEIKDHSLTCFSCLMAISSEQ
jgi:hypothetical protein